jgi:hypothetical protein
MFQVRVEPRSASGNTAVALVLVEGVDVVLAKKALKAPAVLP